MGATVSVLHALIARCILRLEEQTKAIELQRSVWSKRSLSIRKYIQYINYIYHVHLKSHRLMRITLLFYEKAMLNSICLSIFIK